MFARVAITFLLCLPTLLYAQSADNQWPLPKLANVSIVVKFRHSFAYPLPIPGERLRDTQAVFFVSRDGLTRLSYRGAAGACIGKEQYEYKDSLLMRRTSFNSLDPHTPFASPDKHSHRQVSEETWTYEGDKVKHFQETVGPGKTMAKLLSYRYDGKGRLASERSVYAQQSLMYYSRRYDSVTYRYYGDSVFKRAFKSGLVTDSVSYVEHRNKAGLLTEVIYPYPDGKGEDREVYHYDTAKRLSIYECFGNKPVLDRKGGVLRADRIEYVYDEKGRLEEERYFARGIKRWAYTYSYLK